MNADQTLKVLEHYGLLENLSFGQDMVQVLCPFHDSETRPSLCVYVQQGSFFCFGCEAKGSMIDFVGRMEHVDSLHAMIMARKIAGGLSESTVIIPRISYKKALEDARIYFFTLPKTDWRNVGANYLESRGFTERTLATFDVRINPGSTHQYVIPLRDNGSRFLGYVARRADNQEPRYLYNQGFLRRATLPVPSSGLVTGPVLVTEGVMDMMKAWQHGFRNVCCLLGWKAATHHLNLIRIHATEVICALDNDSAGERGYVWLKNQLPLVKRFVFPAKVKDIGEMGKAQFWTALEKSHGTA